MDRDHDVAGIRENGEFDELDIDGLEDGAVAIDYGKESPRVILQVESFDEIVKTHDEDAYTVVAVSPLPEDFHDAQMEAE